ncbi:MAG TPA: Mur ligase family protein [Acidimicrobiales bacterium]|nr:Mur ligase family protein [Acidimicrobiales bacterium]
MELTEALRYLESHVNLEAVLATRHQAPSLERMRELVGLMGDPQKAYPVIHLTGTNGKGSTARMITALMSASGLSVGTYTSPDLERINERIAWNGEPIPDGDLSDVLSSLSDLELLMSATPSRFDLLTAAALRWFADVAVDVAVLEVGLGGRWDATNVADGAVSVVTNVELDHMELLGPTRAHIAAEKAGIARPGSPLVLGETDPDLYGLFEAERPDPILLRGRDYACESTKIAHGGRLLSLRTPGATYPEVYLPLHGGHQGDNAAAALTAAEAFFGAPLDTSVVEEAFASVRTPGRMEVLGRHPLRILDGAHNPAGARAAAATLDEEFSGVAGRILVVGILEGREPEEMLAAMGAERARLVVATSPPSPRAVPASVLADAARAMGVEVVESEPVAEAVRRAVAEAHQDELVLVIGSLYVVGAARTALRPR